MAQEHRRQLQTRRRNLQRDRGKETKREWQRECGGCGKGGDRRQTRRRNLQERERGEREREKKAKEKQRESERVGVRK